MRCIMVIRSNKFDGRRERGEIRLAPRRFSEMKLLPIKVTIEPSRFLLIILHKLQVSHGYKFIGNKGKYFRYFRPRKLNEAILLEIEHARMQGSISMNIFSSFFNFIVITSVDNYYNMLEIFRKGFSRGKVEMKRKKKEYAFNYACYSRRRYNITRNISARTCKYARNHLAPVHDLLSLFSKKKKKKNAKIMRPVKNVKTLR